MNLGKADGQLLEKGVNSRRTQRRTLPWKMQNLAPLGWHHGTSLSVPRSVPTLALHVSLNNPRVVPEFLLVFVVGTEDGTSTGSGAALRHWIAWKQVIRCACQHASLHDIVGNIANGSDNFLTETADKYTNC
jgi:hypothetical protein